MERMMKTSACLVASAVALAMAPAQAELALNDNLSLSGWVSSSISSVDPDSGESSESIGLDEVEINLHLDLGEGVTAQVDIDHGDTRSGGDGGSGVNVEQAHVRYSLAEEGASVVAGRFLSSLGFESFNQPGMYEISSSVATVGVYPGHQNGIAIDAPMGMAGFYAAIVADIWDATEKDLDDVGFEVQLRATPADGLVAKLGYAVQEMSAMTATDDMAASADMDKSLINFWVSYLVGQLTLVAEYNIGDDWGGADWEGDGFLVMANYAVTDKLGLTVRHSQWETENAGGATVAEISEVTISPSYIVTDNLKLVGEVRFDEDDLSGSDTDSLALQALLTF